MAVPRQPSRNRRRATWALLGLVVLCGVSALGPQATAETGPASTGGFREAPPAHAISIDAVPAARLTSRAAVTGTVVYIKADDVWIARPDGSGERQLTHDGTPARPYFTPSEDDTGHVVAGHGTNGVVRLDQAGHLLQAFPVPVSSLGMAYVQVSPDGSTIAYDALFARTGCIECVTQFQHQLHYSSATRSAEVPGTTSQDDVTYATWMSSSRTLLQTASAQEVAYHDLGSVAAHVWYDDCDDAISGCAADVFEYTPAESRQGLRYASSVEILPPSGPIQAELDLLETTGATTDDPPAVPGVGCAVHGPDLTTPFPSPADLTISSPSWAPDGSAVVFAHREPDTGWEVDRFDVPTLDDCSTVTGVEIIPGGSQPSWSPAPLTDPPPPGSGPGKPGHNASGSLDYRGRRPHLRGHPVPGARLHLSRSVRQLEAAFAPDATKLHFKWLRDGRAIRHANRATYRVTRADRHHRISVRITATHPGLTAARITTSAVRIR
jgi:hypothetical protein